MGAVEAGEIEPAPAGMRAGGDGGAILPLGSVELFAALGQPRLDPVGGGLVLGGEHLGLSQGLVLAAAEKAGGFHVELGEIGAGGGARAVELHGALEGAADARHHAHRGHEAGVRGLLAHGASQPQLVVAGRRFERHRALGGRGGFFPASHVEVGAGEQVVGLSIVGRGLDAVVERAQGVIHASHREQLGRRCGLGRRPRLPSALRTARREPGESETASALHH